MTTVNFDAIQLDYHMTHQSSTAACDVIPQKPGTGGYRMVDQIQQVYYH
jgi:hypothetical protein